MALTQQLGPTERLLETLPVNLIMMKIANIIKNHGKSSSILDGALRFIASNFVKIALVAVAAIGPNLISTK